MLTDVQAYCVIFWIRLFRATLTAAAIYRKTSEAKLFTQDILHKKRFLYGEKKTVESTDVQCVQI